MSKSKKRETPPKAPHVSPASVAVPPAPSHKGGRPKGWKPSEHGKDPGGRPTEWTTEVINRLADDLESWAALHTSCYLESFCRDHRTYPQRLSEFAESSAKFAEALKVAKSSCASHIAEATAGGEMPPAFGIFALKQRGWTDKTEVVQSGKVEQVHSGALTVNVTPLADILNGPTVQ